MTAESIVDCCECGALMRCTSTMKDGAFVWECPSCGTGRIINDHRSRWTLSRVVAVVILAAFVVCIVVMGISYFA